MSVFLAIILSIISFLLLLCLGDVVGKLNDSQKALKEAKRKLVKAEQEILELRADNDALLVYTSDEDEDADLELHDPPTDFRFDRL